MTNSFRGGTGKSTIISNLASYIASFGMKVVIMDGDTVSPGVHAIFGLNQDSFSTTVTDYLKGTADIRDTVYDISGNLELPDETLFLAASSILKGDIAELLRARMTGEKLVAALPKISKAYEPDFILIDTHPGLNEEVLVAYEAVDILLNVARPDNQDYQGLEVTSGISERLKMESYVILNRVHEKIRNKQLKKKIEKTYKVPVAGMLPDSEDVILSQSQFVFSDRYPDHEFSREIHNIANFVFGIKPREHLELMQFLLKDVKDAGQIALSELLTQRNVESERCRQYTDEMLSREFIARTRQDGKDMILITDKGEKFLKKYKTIRKFVDDFRL